MSRRRNNHPVVEVIKTSKTVLPDLDPFTPRQHMVQILQAVFPSFPWDDDVSETARRFLSYLGEYEPQTDINFEFTTFEADINQQVLMKNIEFRSVCIHHLLPFWGVAHVAYIPNRKMVGASKIPRLVDFWSRRPQTQEYITASIASDLKHRLECMGVAVLLHARHPCISCRGVSKMDAEMVTSEMRGVYLTNPASRAEFMSSVLLKLE